MRIILAIGLAALAASSLTSCNDGNTGGALSTSTTPGTLVENPPFRIASLSAAALTAQLNASPTGQQLLAISGAPKCGVDFHLMQYATVGGANPPEQTRASGSLMAPTGGAGCSGARPIVEYAHGTSVLSSYNIADPTNQANDAWQETVMIAAFFAAQGYIVVAPNYVGYDTQDVATLSYHPYLNAAQQSQEMIDALAAARTALQSGIPSGVTDNGKLFLTGYSQGGHVAMATHKAMQAAGMTVTASAPMSGPYALEAFGDAVVTYGNVGLGSTVYYPLVINSYQHAYGNLYTATTDIYGANYATGIDTLLPGPVPDTTLFQEGKLPEFALFDSTTPVTGTPLDPYLAVPTNGLFALGFGNPYLIVNGARVQYALDSAASPDGAVPVPSPGVPLATTPQYPLRVALKKNDMRSWTPNGTTPMLLCGGHNDPEVFFSLNTGTMEAYWPTLISSPGTPNVVTVLDVDPDVTASGIATSVGTLAATAYANALAGASPSAAQISSGVLIAVVSNTAFAPYFTGGVPNSPQGVLVAGVANVAAQAAGLEFTAGVRDPAAVGAYVGDAINKYYHFPVVQSSCLTAVGGFFLGFHPFN